jgi:hypothetical protein
LEKLKGIDHLEDLDVDGKTIRKDLREIVRCELDASGSGYGPVESCC